MCVVDVKYNHLLVVDMAGVACRGLWSACGWKNAGPSEAGRLGRPGPPHFSCQFFFFPCGH